MTRPSGRARAPALKGVPRLFFGGHMKRSIGVAMALAVAGCGTVSNVRYDIKSGSFDERTKAVIQSCEARMRAPALDPIRAKVELFKSPADGPAPFAILTNSGLPDANDRQTIDLWARAVEQCQAQARPLIGAIPVPPDATQSQVDKLAAYITDAWIESSKLRVALYNGQLTYADYASQRVKIAEDALRTASRYAQDTDEENDTHDLEDSETALERFASMM